MSSIQRAVCSCIHSLTHLANMHWIYSWFLAIYYVLRLHWWMRQSPYYQETLNLVLLIYDFVFIFGFSSASSYQLDCKSIEIRDVSFLEHGSHGKVIHIKQALESGKNGHKLKLFHYIANEYFTLLIFISRSLFVK